ncbi:MAG TPA: hypothetical protein VN763_01350, partial [Saprospiraceae bacterium]|nr:hypothetical protein [Saprospiraceae bacterium]
MLRFNSYRNVLLFTIFIFSMQISSYAQRSGKGSSVYVDKKGVMRWSKSNAEVQGFGVNYTVPFAHAYRAAKTLNISPKDAIDNDVYHFARL